MNNQTVIEGVYNIIPKLNPPSKKCFIPERIPFKSKKF